MLRKHSTRRAQFAVFGLCLAWAAFVHATFLLTLDGDVAEHWVAPLRGTPAVYPVVALLFFQYFFTAFGLVLGLLALQPWIRSPARFGTLVGLLLGLWSNTEFLTVPYCGAYTSLPGAMLGSVLSGGANKGLWYYGPVLVTNIVLWPVVVCLVCWIPPIRRLLQGVNTEVGHQGHG
jgi:hypothetical protein